MHVGRNASDYHRSRRGRGGLVDIVIVPHEDRRFALPFVAIASTLMSLGCQELRKRKGEIPFETSHFNRRNKGSRVEASFLPSISVPRE
jgi:hypothetical protein